MAMLSTYGTHRLCFLQLLLIFSCGVPSICHAQTIDELQRSRTAVYEELVSIGLTEHKTGSGSQQEVFDAKVMLLDAKIEAAPDAKARIKLLKEKVKAYVEQEAFQNAAFSEGIVSRKSMLLTKVQKIEAQIALSRAGETKLAKVTSTQTGIEKLAADQLAAYNRADLDAFCACYHPEVRVFDGDIEKPAGMKEFRKRYVKMFEKGGFSATVSKRVVHGSHCIDLEHWKRDNGRQGTVLVRYTEKDGLIGIVQFLR